MTWLKNMKTFRLGKIWDTVIAGIVIPVAIGLILYVWLGVSAELLIKAELTVAIGTSALAIATAVSTWHTRKMAKEMREQRCDAVRPVIDIQMYSATDAVKMGEQMSTMEVLISSGMGCDFMNIGLGPATDVQPYIQDEWGKRLFNCGIIGKDKKAPYQMHLALIEENKSAFVKVIYRDIFGRLLESKRELVGERTNWMLGPLQTTVVEGSKS